MAQKVQVHVIISDDLDGSENAETYTFGWQGRNYEIDLSDKNAKELENFISKYVTHGRVIAQQRGGAKPKKPAPTASEIRDWARANGVEVPDKGRIPAEVNDAYKAANR